MADETLLTEEAADALGLQCGKDGHRIALRRLHERIVLATISIVSSHSADLCGPDDNRRRLWQSGARCIKLEIADRMEQVYLREGREIEPMRACIIDL